MIRQSCAILFGNDMIMSIVWLHTIGAIGIHIIFFHTTKRRREKKHTSDTLEPMMKLHKFCSGKRNSILQNCTATDTRRQHHSPLIIIHICLSWKFLSNFSFGSDIAVLMRIDYQNSASKTFHELWLYLIVCSYITHI